MILMLDNYDSFTFNLVRYLKELNAPVEVYRNDEITVADIQQMQPEKIIISPGPGRPEDAGICIELINTLAGVTPILGVCLGHQAIAQAYGANIVNAKNIMHGKTSQIHHNNHHMFREVQNPFTATRYHSLSVDEASLSNDFEITGWTELDNKKEIMAIAHKELALFGVQFHPESVLTEFGHRILQNFIHKISPSLPT